MLIRYISHEMRTPLNTVSMGLQVLDKKLIAGDDVPDTRSVVADIKLSCDNTVNILNDLLTCDKIESGILALEMSKLSPKLFLEEVCQPFYLQVDAVLHYFICLFTYFLDVNCL
jgi:two-component system, sensor histidine kinase